MGGDLVDITAIGDILRSRRKALGLMQGDVAEHLGVSPQAVSKWERGENLPDMAFFPGISKLLQISIDEILHGAQISPDADTDSFVYMTAAQKTRLIERILAQDDYAGALDDILPYCNAAHRGQIVGHILAAQDYALIEQVATYMSNEMKAQALARLLTHRRFDIIEDNMPAFTRKHRDLIVDFFTENHTDEDIIENFIPFFDNNQRERLRVALTSGN